MTSFRDRAAAIGVELPKVPVPIANFLPYKVAGSVIYLAGQTCEWNGTMTLTGKIGRDHDLDAGRRAARACALNLIAVLARACGDDMARVGECIRLGGFVNAPEGYPLVPRVIDGASDMMLEFFGPSGSHARTAIGVSTLPQDAAVEVDAIFELRLA